jgi:hypothetical protein
VHGGPHAGVAVANPPGSGAAHHSFPEPQACLHRAVPHGIQPDPLRQPMGARPRAGPLEARAAPDLGISCGWNFIWGLNVFYFQKHYFYL